MKGWGEPVGGRGSPWFKAQAGSRLNGDGGAGRVLPSRPTRECRSPGSSPSPFACIPSYRDQDSAGRAGVINDSTSSKGENETGSTNRPFLAAAVRLADAGG